MVSAVINNSESCIRNGGWHSSWFPCERGVRQGCCVSPYLFLLVAEILSIKLQNSNEFKGISITSENLNLCKVVQYADDLSLFVKNENELEAALIIIDNFGMVSGLKLNRQKSMVLPFGGYQRSFKSVHDVTWLRSEEFIKILGIYFSGETEASKIDMNWKPKIENMLKIVNRWSKREISLYGRVILCKTFLLSQINYVIQSLVLPEHALNQIDSIFFKFIWQKRDSKKKVFEKIKRKFLCLDCKQGGLKMISIKDQQKVYNIKWISRVVKEKDSQTAIFANLFLENVGGISYITKSSLSHPEQFFDKFVKNSFWKNAVCSWSSLHHHLQKNSPSIQDILFQPLFLNSNIQYKKSNLLFPRWIKNNVLFICDILENRSLKSRNGLVSILGNYALLTFEHNALINALPTHWVSDMCSISNEEVKNARSNRWKLSDTEKQILNMKNFEIRSHILNSYQFIKHNESLWRVKLGIDIVEYYDIATKATKESKLRLLHFKILHNIYPTNILLSKMKVKPSELCETCRVPDFIEHFFYECSPIHKFWSHVNNLIRIKFDINIALNKNNVLMGIASREFPNLNRKTLELINAIILLGKLCVSKFRYGRIKNLTLIFELEYALRYGL